MIPSFNQLIIAAEIVHESVLADLGDRGSRDIPRTSQAIQMLREALIRAKVSQSQAEGTDRALRQAKLIIKACIERGWLPTVSDLEAIERAEMGGV